MAEAMTFSDDESGDDSDGKDDDDSDGPGAPRDDKRTLDTHRVLQVRRLCRDMQGCGVWWVVDGVVGGRDSVGGSDKG